MGKNMPGSCEADTRRRTRAVETKLMAVKSWMWRIKGRKILYSTGLRIISIEADFRIYDNFYR